LERALNNLSDTRPDILCFSSTDWDGIWGSRQQVMLRFARRGYRVFLVERPAGPEHLLRYPDLRWRKLRRWREGLQAVADNLWIVSLPPLLPGRYYLKAINRVNQWLTVHWSTRYLNRLDFTSPILWIYNPEQGPLIGHFGERLSVYHCIDEFTAGTSGRKRRTIAALEGDLLAKADVVFANSSLTFENKRRFNPHTYCIPSAADVDHFAQALNPKLPLPPAIAAISHPVAGFVGNVTDRLDISLLAQVIGQLPDWQFVFIGQTYPQKVDLSPLTKLCNVHFLGKHSFWDLPSLVKGIDVFLLPYVSDELARYRSPLKLYEYLAAGRPIVSTMHPEVQEMSDVVHLASTPNEFAIKLTRALVEDSPEQQQQRLAVARQHSWDLRVDEMERILNQFFTQISRDAVENITPSHNLEHTTRG
jgi:glycosyltransferase involved in cell wall biosynthesis